MSSEICSGFKGKPGSKSKQSAKPERGKLDIQKDSRKVQLPDVFGIRNSGITLISRAYVRSDRCSV
jgi:hypothetical protein